MNSNRKELNNILDSNNMLYVTFNHEVCSYGDGTTEALTFYGDVLNDKDSIKQKSQATYVYKPIIETKNNLLEKMLQ